MHDRPPQTVCRCGEGSVRYRSSQWLCVQHYRFMCMRESAQRRQVTVPTYDELQAMLDVAVMICPVCQRTMNWLRRDGSQTVLTLQHDRDGTMRFLCMSCNCRHWAYADDSFYAVGPHKKRCNHCEEIKGLPEFCMNNSARWANKNNVCKDCALLYHQRYIEENRVKYNAYMRQYKARKKHEQAHVRALGDSILAEVHQIEAETRG